MKWLWLVVLVVSIFGYTIASLIALRAGVNVIVVPAVIAGAIYLGLITKEYAEEYWMRR